jgi:hypothetical protein
VTARRFPPPCSVEDIGAAFVAKDSNGQKLGYVYFDDPRAAAKPLTRDESLHQGPRWVSFRLHDPRTSFSSVLRARNRARINISF